MNIGGKRISDTDYMQLLNRLCAYMEETPIRGVLVYNIIYDLVSSRPSYEARLYQDLCRFLHSRVRQDMEYLPGFTKYKTLALALSGLCSLLHDTLGCKYRRLDDMAFLIWERIMLRDRDIGEWLVREIRSDVTAEKLFGHGDVNAREIEAVCREICFGDSGALPEHLLETLKSEDTTVLKDCIFSLDSPFRRKDIRFVDEKHAKDPAGGVHVELCPETQGNEDYAHRGRGLCGTHALKSGSRAVEELMFRCHSEAEKECESLNSEEHADSPRSPYHISYSSIRKYLETLTYIVPDPSSPLLYYITTYEMKALTRIACETSMPDTSFDVYTSFAYMKLSSEMKRMSAIFLDHSYPKLLKVIDHVLITTRKEWLQNMLRGVLDEPQLLKKYFCRLRLFPSFKLVFTGVFEEFLKEFIERHVTKSDLSTMYDALSKITSYTETYLSKEWLAVVRQTFSKYLNGVKGIAAIFVKFTDSMLFRKRSGVRTRPGPAVHTDRYTEIAAAARDGGASREAASRVCRDAPGTCLKSTEWAVFNELFALLEAKCEFSELYVLSLHERLLKSPDIVQERMLLGALVGKGCSADFRRRVETMIADIEESREYTFEVTNWLTRYARDASTAMSPSRSPCADSNALCTDATEGRAVCGHAGQGFFGHVRSVEFPEIEQSVQSAGTAAEKADAVLVPEAGEYIDVRPHILNSGTWSFTPHKLTLPRGLAHILSFFEARLKLNRRRRYFSWIHDKSAMVVEIVLRRKVVVELNTLQYCVLVCVVEKSTADEVSSLCGCSKTDAKQTLGVFVEVGLVIQEAGSEKALKDALGAPETRTSASQQEADKYYVINMNFDRPFVQIADGARAAKKKTPADLKQTCQSMICRAMKRKKSLCYNDLLDEVGDVGREFFDGALHECVVQGYLEKDGSMYRYVP